MEKISPTAGAVCNGCLVYEQQGQNVGRAGRYPVLVRLAGNGHHLHLYLRGGNLYRAQGTGWQSARRVVLASLSSQARTTLPLLPGRLHQSHVGETAGGGPPPGGRC